MDEQTTDGLKDTARQHADREEVRAGIPLFFAMLVAGILGALAARSVLNGGLVEWIAMIAVFVVTAHITGTVYGWAYSKLRGDGSEQ